jgi:hypothetical protein
VKFTRHRLTTQIYDQIGGWSGSSSLQRHPAFLSELLLHVDLPFLFYVSVALIVFGGIGLFWCTLQFLIMHWHSERNERLAPATYHPIQQQKERHD